MAAMTWRDLANFLNTLAIRGDKRLDDRVIVYDSEVGEYKPADVVEFNDENDPIMTPNQLFIFSHEWGAEPSS